MRLAISLICLTAICLHAAPAPAFPAEWFAVPSPTRDVIAAPAAAAPTIDGHLNDPCWTGAGKVSGYLRIKTPSPAAERTAVAFTYDRDHLYIAAVVADTVVVGKPRDRDAGTWEDDCVEIFLDPQRQRRDRFHVIISAANMIYDASLGKEAWHLDGLRTATQRVAGRGWLVEAAIPFAALDIKPPRTGDVWDLKLSREDYARAGAMPRLSSWQFIAQTFADAGAFGRLIFGSRNRSENGDFTRGLEKPWTNGSMWRLSPQTKPGSSLTLAPDDGRTAAPAGRVEMTSYSQVQHIVRVQPQRNYRLSAWVNIDGLDGRRALSFYTERHNRVSAKPDHQGWQRLETFAVSGDSDWQVLTFTCHGTRGHYLVDDIVVEELDNVPRPPGALCYTGNAVGSQAAHNHRPAAARYTYTEIGSTAPYFPQARQRATPDVPAIGGWIPFTAGKLTDGKPSYVQYQHWSKNPGKTIIFDLGADHFITDVEIEPVLRKLRSPQLYVRPDGAAVDTLVANRPGRHGITQFTGIDARARYVRVDADGECGYREIRIWGRDEPEGGQPVPWAAPTKAADASGGPALAAPGFFIFPTPKSLTVGDGVFVLPRPLTLGTAADAAPACTAVADQIAGELAAATGLTVSAPAAGTPAAIRLRLARPNAANRPEGYTLTITEDSAVVTGSDRDGLFYGCQALLQCLTTTADGAALQQVTVEDWPSYPFRAFQVWGRQLKDEQVRRSLAVLARLRLNQLFLMGSTKADIPHAQRLQTLGMDTVILACGMPSGGWHRGCTETFPGETEADLPSRERTNPCPSNPLTHERMAEEIRHAALFPGAYAYINCDEMYQEHKGARWNVCDLCTARKLSGGALFAEFLGKIHSELKAIGKTPVLLDTMLHVPYRGMDEAFAALPKDMPIGIWHPRVQQRCAALGYPVWEFFDGDVWTIDEKAEHVIGGLVPGDGGMKIDRGVVFAEALWSGTQPDLRDPNVLCRLSHVMTRVHEAIIDTLLPSKRAAPGRFETVPLNGNTELADSAAGDGVGLFDLGPGTDLRFIAGRHMLNGVPFAVGQRIVAVDNRAARDARLPATMSIPVGRQAASLIALHTMTRPMPWTYSAQVRYAGTYIVAYADGTQLAFPVRYKHNILEYDTQRTAAGNYKSALVSVPEAMPAYRGTLRDGSPILLLAAEWVNPWPDKTIASVTLQSTSRGIGTRLALFALTTVAPSAVDRDLAGRRPAPAPLAPRPAAPADLDGLVEVSLAGGTHVSDREYKAADGTVIAADSCYTLAGATYIRPMAVGLVTDAGDSGWQITDSKPANMTITFPAPRWLAAISLLGLPETPEYIFGEASEMDCNVALTADGTVWQELPGADRYLADRDWELVRRFTARQVMAVRITLTRGSPQQRVRGLARVRLYAPAER
jgi:hypothetical protein